MAATVAVRPKVCRMPAKLAPAKPQKPALPGFLMFWGTVFVALLAVSIAVRKQPDEYGDVNSASVPVLPRISVTPSTPSTEETSSIRDVSSVLPTAISDAQAASALGALTEQSGKTIFLQGESGAIIGQMAKIPLENEHITEIKAINDIDNGAGRELLSIISKY